MLLVGLADAVVAVAIHPLARVPVVQVHVGRAVRTGPRAELREVALPGLFTAQCARGQQLSRGTRKGDKVNLPPVLNPPSKGS